MFNSLMKTHFMKLWIKLPENMFGKKTKGVIFIDQFSYYTK